MTAQLKLIALDADDLAVISAHVQDARVQAADIIWRQGEKRLVVGMNRLDWEQTLAGETMPRRLVVGAAVRPGAVVQVAQYRSGRRRRPRWNCSGSNFIPARPPGGSAVLLFSQRRRAAAGCRMPGMRTGRSRRRRSRHRRSRRGRRAVRAGCVSILHCTSFRPAMSSVDPCAVPPPIVRSGTSVGGSSALIAAFDATPPLPAASG